MKVSVEEIRNSKIDFSQEIGLNFIDENNENIHWIFLEKISLTELFTKDYDGTEYIFKIEDINWICL